MSAARPARTLTAARPARTLTAARRARRALTAARPAFAIALGLAIVLGACDAGRAVAPAMTAASSSVPTQAGPTQAASIASGGVPSTVPNAPVVDRTLLTVLPPTVDGIALVESPDAEATAIADPLLKVVGSALAAAIAVDPASGQFVYAVVVRLVPGEMTGTQFSLWRDAYDTGACAQAGGVDGHVESQIGGRTVLVGACKGGLRTYHVWLQARDLLVSASSVGDRRLGETLLANLRP